MFDDVPEPVAWYEHCIMMILNTEQGWLVVWGSEATGTDSLDQSECVLALMYVRQKSPRTV